MFNVYKTSQDLLDAALKNGLTSLANDLRKREADDPFFINPLRAKESDDTTAMLLRVVNEPAL
jgi:hypothetical protein